MEINQEENKRSFKTIAGMVSEEQLPAVEKLLTYLEKTDFYSAPASAKYHLAVPGGLCQHSLDVYQNMLNLFGIFCPQKDEAAALKATETCVLLGLFHDLCKVNLYKPCSRNVKNSETGEGTQAASYTVEDGLCYGHGEGSVYMLQSFGIKLTREQALAIRWHMGGFDAAARGGDSALANAMAKYPLVTILHAADLLSTYVTEHGA